MNEINEHFARILELSSTEPRKCDIEFKRDMFNLQGLNMILITEHSNDFFSWEILPDGKKALSYFYKERYKVKLVEEANAIAKDANAKSDKANTISEKANTIAEKANCKSNISNIIAAISIGIAFASLIYTICH